MGSRVESSPAPKPCPSPDSMKFRSQPAGGSLEEKTKRADLGLI